MEKRWKTCCNFSGNWNVIFYYSVNSFLKYDSLQGPAGNDGTPGRDGAVGERVRAISLIKKSGVM